MYSVCMVRKELLLVTWKSARARRVFCTVTWSFIWCKLLEKYWARFCAKKQTRNEEIRGKHEGFFARCVMCKCPTVTTFVGTARHSLCRSVFRLLGWSTHNNYTAISELQKCESTFHSLPQLRKDKLKPRSDASPLMCGTHLMTRAVSESVRWSALLIRYDKRR